MMCALRGAGRGFVFVSAVLAFCIRLFPVLRWEAAIHDLDPWFNYRATEFLATNGYERFTGWVDGRVWFPLGRPVGTTTFPGLMVSAWSLHVGLSAVGIPLSLKDACVYTGPLFAAAASIATYGVAWEVSRRDTTALLASFFMAIVPAYVSRSTAGAFDNEAVAIFAFVLTLFMWLRALSSGRIAWAAATAIAFFFMAASWGGYVLALNVVALHAAVLITTGRFMTTLSRAYCVFYVLGILLVIQVPVLGVATLFRAEWVLSHVVFGLITVCLVAGTYSCVRDTPGSPAQIVHMYGHFRRIVGIWAVVPVVLLFLVTSHMNPVVLVIRDSSLLERSLAAIDPTFAKRTSPMVASVAEHQPSLWTSFVFDFHVLIPFSVAGVFFVCERLTVAGLLIVVYGSVSLYFSSTMVRLLLTLAPATCILAAVGVIGLLDGLLVPDMSELDVVETAPTEQEAQSTYPLEQPRRSLPLIVKVVGSTGVASLVVLFARHALYAAREQYSSTGLVIPASSKSAEPRQRRPFFDDFREAYAWMRANTADDSRIAAWWDYGYQLNGMANRTSFADGNTWNYSHIAVLGRALVSSEDIAHAILSDLRATHVMVVCGAKTGYTHDDIGKFLWPVRVAASVFSDITESMFLAKDGQFRLDSAGSPATLNSALFKLCYHRYGTLRTSSKQPFGFDVARRTVIGNHHFELSHFQEVFTTRNWLVRVYQLRGVDETTLSIKKSKNAYGSKSARRASTAHTTSTEGDAAKVVAPLGLRYAGCYRLEAAFAGDRVYNRGVLGTRLSEARAHAVASHKPYLAIARLGQSDGHAYALSAPVFGPDVAPSAGCGRACDDVMGSACGCAESWCNGLTPEPGQTSARR